jgi:plasmid stabilization system protein ParE
MYQLVLTPAAQSDISEAAFWYNNQKKGLGLQFVKRIKSTASKLRRNPHLFQIHYDDVHTAIIKQFPYSIHYTVQNNIIVIHAVLHHHRNPNLWHNSADEDL